MAFFNSLKKKWHKYALVLFLFLVLTMSISTAISKLYQFWDVGSDSWFDRLKGEGWQFQRGAATMPQPDPFGDQFSTIQYLQQGWKPADSMWFYNTTQGSDLLPYDFFMAVEKPGTTEPFHSDQNMNYYRYLPQKPTLSDPDGLPVGFVKDRYKGKDYLGFTCAACHTTQLNYNHIGIRIDGGPAATDMDSFLQALADAVWTAQTDPSARARFVKNVMDRGHYASEDAVLNDLQEYGYRLKMYNVINHSETRYGYSRLDAFGRIFNRVLEHVITQKELKQELDLTIADLVKKGTLTQSDIDSIVQQQKGGILTDTQRDHLVLRLAQKLPFKVLDRLKERIFNRPDAPVSYPFLWDIPQHDYVQWNGLAPNAGLGPIGRNAGEAIGVFATMDWREEPGWSIWSVLGGQGFKTTHISFESSVNVQNLRLIESRLKRLQSPQWPEDILGKLDRARLVRGERLFTTYCESCHTRIQRDDPERRIVAHMSRTSDIGTDTQMAHNSTAYTGLSGILRNQYVAAGPGDILINERAPAGALLTKATLNVVATPEHKNVVRRVYQWAYNLVVQFLSNPIKPSLKNGNYDPDTSAEPFASLNAYKARSLNGIWATAPYLHNGSVPSLYELLLPKRGSKDSANGEYRPDTFLVGSREFDPVKVGLKSSAFNNGFVFETSHRGNSNDGHPYGTNLSRDERLDLLEYLKSL